MNEDAVVFVTIYYNVSREHAIKYYQDEIKRYTKLLNVLSKLKETTE